MAGKAGHAQKRKELEGPSECPSHEKEKGVKSTTAGKSLSSLVQHYKETHPEEVKGSGAGVGTGAKRPASTVPPINKDKMFRPDWSVLRTNTAFANPDVARELLRKVVLEKGALRIEKEVPATAFGSGFASIYQLSCY
ncbi:uncharacterized protein LOC143891418 [Tasmannia lanceolata]|uniref:uncharacterized protein LOC143891418 n=1 Tax=Tasmannia lanceolata TaxID=3420 RepID=UPI0040648ED8